MKIVIDIDETIYNSIKIGMRNRDEVENIMEQIEKGTPLPKGEWHNEDGTLDGTCDGWMSIGVKCSVCGVVHCGYMRDYNYCPNCGAKMEVENG